MTNTAPPPLEGVEVTLGDAKVSLIFNMGALRKAFERFKGRDIQELLNDLRGGDFDAVCALTAIGLRHLRTYTEDRVSDLLDAYPHQTVDCQVACMLALANGYKRTMPKAAREEVDRAGEAAAAAALTVAAASTVVGPTSTPPSAPAPASDTTPT